MASSKLSFPSSKLKKRLIFDDEPTPQARWLHLKPIWVVLFFLVPCLLLTMYYAPYSGLGGRSADSLLPNPSYALVMFLIYLDVVGLVVLTLLLSRNFDQSLFRETAPPVGVGVSHKTDCRVSLVFIDPHPVVSGDGQ